jgi:NodT family efflux transporter outer membrane factor (OMF) lipoprotein
MTRGSRQRARPVAALAAAVAWAIATTGCALNPAPEREDLNREAFGFTEPPAAWSAPADAGTVEGGWLAAFDDPQLAALVEEALAHNPDLRAASLQVERAAATVRIAGGSIYPAVNLIGRTSTSNGSGAEPLNAAILSASWELDLWGRVRYGRRAAEEQFAAAEADYLYARQSLAALVVRSWLLACEASLQAALAADSLAGAEKLLSLAMDRQRVGIGSEVEVATARASRDDFRDALRRLEYGKEQSLRALELLLGRYPATELEAADRLPALVEAAPAGVPAELLERRPDLVAAERRVAAAFSRTGEAQAARLPRLTLSASGSYLDSDILVLKDRDNPVWGLGLGLVMPIYAGGALAAQVELRTVEQQAAVAQYASTGLKAFGEVEDALAAEAAAADRVTILESQVRDRGRALELEEVRYRVGNADLRSVTQQQLSLYASRSTLLRMQSERLAQRVALYLALGGDFGDQAS